MLPSIEDGCRQETTTTNRPRDLAIQGFVEAMVVLSTATIVTPFIAKHTPFYWSPYFIGGTILLTNNLMRWYQVNSTDDAFCWLTQKARGLVFTNFDLLYRGVFIHELGHALANRYYYPNSNPQILITPPSGGYTHSRVLLPNHHFWIETITSLSGTVAVITWAYLSLILARLLPIKYGEAKSHLRISSIASVLGAAWYAISGSWSCEPRGHDFCRLDELNAIAPINAALIILCSLLCLHLALSYPESKRENEVQPLPCTNLMRFGFFQKADETSYQTGKQLSV